MANNPPDPKLNAQITAAASGINNAKDMLAAGNAEGALDEVIKSQAIQADIQGEPDVLLEPRLGEF